MVYRKKISHLNMVCKTSHNLVLTFLMKLIFYHSPQWTSCPIIENHIQFLYTTCCLWLCSSSSLWNTFLLHLANSTHLSSLSSGTFLEFQVETSACSLSCTYPSRKKEKKEKENNVFVSFPPIGQIKLRDHAVITMMMMMTIAEFIALTRYQALYMNYLIFKKLPWGRYY